jgi:outer membrane protein TolC
VLVSATCDRQEREALLGRVAHLEATLASTQTRLVSTQTTLAQVTAQRDKLQRAYEQLKEQLELLRRRIYAAKAERIDVTQLEIEFAQTTEKLAVVGKELAEQVAPPSAPLPPSTPPPPSSKPRPKPTGRRDLSDEDIPDLLRPRIVARCGGC